MTLKEFATQQNIPEGTVRSWKARGIIRQDERGEWWFTDATRNANATNPIATVATCNAEFAAELQRDDATVCNVATPELPLQTQVLIELCEAQTAIETLQDEVSGLRARVQHLEILLRMSGSKAVNHYSVDPPGPIWGA